MIGELGQSAQMICTTFRPEMLEHADAFWGVIFDTRKISTIQSIAKAHAQQFVESSVPPLFSRATLTPSAGTSGLRLSRGSIILGHCIVS